MLEDSLKPDSKVIIFLRLQIIQCNFLAPLFDLLLNVLVNSCRHVENVASILWTSTQHWDVIVRNICALNCNHQSKYLRFISTCMMYL